ncbi:GPW/gp25 family protein [Brevundimonas sp.]|uniref:GPW/gp25 family protein n=1 Tax=Brevundimonas sp. TaxID=1871086 RepID=UPI00286BD6DA|nr:GPW/gp25 family protein [Brevundimonas sp.]
MAGIDAWTGGPLSGWPHVVQSVGLLLTTRLGERQMRGYVGAVTAALLGRLVNKATLLRLLQSIVVAIELFEPRFKVSRVVPVRLERSGRVEIWIEGEYRPRGHLGDPRPEGTRRITLATGDQGQGITTS